MQTADFNHNDFSERGNAADENLLVKFFHKTRPKKGQLPHETPQFTEVEYIEIRVAGSRDPQACRAATLADKSRFPRHYDAFKRRVELPEEGFPLTEWSQINRSLVETLSFLNVKTVEQLSKVSDTHITSIMGGNSFKQKAINWLKERNSNDALARENAELRSEMVAMQAQLAELISVGRETQPVETETKAETKAEKPKAASRRSRKKD